VHRSCVAAGIDPAREPIPVTPAAHYFMGGVRVDGRGRTSIPGLWACGEVSATGAHGANRLASNSLLEAVVFGSVAGADARAAIAGTGETDARALRAAAAPGLRTGHWVDDSPTELRRRLRALMWDHVGLVRDAGGLGRALEQIERSERELADRPGELRNLLCAARWVAAAALARRESRGSHQRADFPRADDSLRRQLPIHPTAIAAGSGRRAERRAV
jgi:L-aspartate oxidase